MDAHFAVRQPCSQSWNQMTGSETVRHCTHCAQSVQHIDHLSSDEVLQMIRERGDLCVRFYERSEGHIWGYRPPVIPEKSMRWWMRSGVLVGLALSSLTGLSGQRETRMTGMLRSDLYGNARIISMKAEIQFGSGQSRRLSIDQEGRFAVTDCEPGVFSLKVTASNHADLTIDGELVAGENRLLEVVLHGKAVLGSVGVLDPVEDYVYRLAERCRVSKGEIFPVHAAAWSGDIGTLIDLQARGWSLNSRSPNGETPLMAACERLDVLTYLLERGANVNAQSAFGSPVLSYALLRQVDSVVYELLSRGADPNLADNKGRTPMHIAALLGRLDYVLAFLDHGGNLDLKDQNRQSMLHFAAASAKPSEALLRFLVDRNGQSLNAVDIWGETPLMKAAFHGNANAVNLLLEFDVDPDRSNLWGQNALHLATFSRSEQVLRSLIQAGCDLNQRDLELHTPLDHLGDGYIRERVTESLRDVIDAQSQP